MRASEAPGGYGTAGLLAVPSVHFRLVFAERVHQLCMAPGTRPDAIAVELDPETAGAAWSWLRELAQRFEKRLPFMLALARDAAAADEDPVESGKQVPLRHSLLYLSPTDSIVEAVRCAVELGVPLYGVDCAVGADRPPHGSFPDPLLASGAVEKYAGQYAALADAGRIQDVDWLREITMAARLRFLTARHARVLFVGGLAHWRRLELLLGRPDLEPKPAWAADGLGSPGFHRILVSPTLAAESLDVYPALAEAFELARADGSLQSSQLDVPGHFAALLRRAAALAWASPRTAGAPRVGVQEDPETCAPFFQLLISLCQVRLRVIPDLATTLTASHSMMNRAFTGILAEELMRCEWASPDEFPELPVMVPVAGPARGARRARLVGTDGEPLTEPFCIELLHGPRETVGMPMPWRWRDLPTLGQKLVRGYKDSWRPRENLITALSLHGTESTLRDRERGRSEVFEGGLRDGLDVKATIRAAARGDNRVFVRDARSRRRRRPGDSSELWPTTVWIFTAHAEPGCTLVPHHDYISSLLLPLARDQASVRALVRSEMTALVHGLGFGALSIDPALSTPDNEVVRLDYCGMAMFQPFCWGPEQTILWAEAVSFKRHPVAELDGYDAASVAGLAELYWNRHGIDIHESGWASSLVRMAIPYAGSELVVFAPDSLQLAGVVDEELGRAGVELIRVPLSRVDPTLVEKARCLIASGITGRDRHDRPIFPEYLIDRIGEPPDACEDWVPRRIRDYGR